MSNPESAARMEEAATAFLDTLDDRSRSSATSEFADTDSRRDWHYIPRSRPGLSFRDMNSRQEQHAYALVATGLSVAAFAAVTTIIGLEDVLDRLEGHARHRHRADYSVTVFDGPWRPSWGWRFEGHHVSINVAVVNGAVAATPLFLGSNPAEVVAPSGAVVARPLAGEEDLAAALFASLTGPQRIDAVVADDAPDDILSTNAPTLEEMPEVAGVRFADLQGTGRAAAEALVHHHLDRLPAPDAEAWWRRLAPELGDLRFAVAGDLGHRRPQYYRVAGRSLFVEYDNTQNDANHVHTVLRDPTGDFGIDLLRDHRALGHDQDARPLGTEGS